jgi:hypothetical protein
VIRTSFLVILVPLARLGNNGTDVVYPVVDSCATGGLPGLDRSITFLAGSPWRVAKSICNGAIAAIIEIRARDSGSPY